MSISKIPSMISDSNQACFAKKAGRRLQEELLEKGGVNRTYESTVWDDTES